MFSVSHFNCHGCFIVRYVIPKGVEVHTVAAISTNQVVRLRSEVERSAHVTVPPCDVDLLVKCETSSVTLMVLDWWFHPKFWVDLAAVCIHGTSFCCDPIS